MNVVRPYWLMVKREVWEHRSFWIVPVVIGCLAIVGTVYGAGALFVAARHGMVNLEGHIFDSNHIDALRMFIIGSAGLFNIAMVLMVSFYLMDCLYADRKDRSILFWRSMPLSDTSAVLFKLFTAMVTAPALMLVVVVMTEIIVGVVFVTALGLMGVNLLALAFQPGVLLISWITLAFGLVVQSLWLMPFYGWFLLCSAWSKKLPLAWTVLIPLGAIAAEGVMLHTHYLATAIFGHIGKLFTLFMSSHYSVNGVTVGTGIDFGGKPAIHGGLMTLGSLAHVVVLPEMWIGVVVGTIFFIGAVWLRRNHSEI